LYVFNCKLFVASEIRYTEMFNDTTLYHETKKCNKNVT